MMPKIIGYIRKTILILYIFAVCLEASAIGLRYINKLSSEHLTPEKKDPHWLEKPS